jgi:aspartyl protease family protein
LFTLSAFAVEDIAVMGLIADKAILKVDGKHRVIHIGESTAEGVQLNSISEDRRNITLSVNGIEKQYRLGVGTNTGGGSAKIVADNSGMYRANGKINGKPIPFIIDTGATYVSLSKKQAVQLGISYQQSTKTGKAETANGLVDIYIVTLDKVELDGIALTNIEAAIHEGEFPNAALLGMSFLNKVKMNREGNLLLLSHH